MMNRALLILLLLAYIDILWAQDPAYTQFHSSPLHLNPAFAGSEGCSRAALNYRNQWPLISGLVTYSLSYDQYVHPLRGGVGIHTMIDDVFSGTIRTSSIYGIYAFKWMIKEKLILSPAFKFGYSRAVLDWDRINFGDMIHPRYGFVFASPGPQQQGPATYFDVSAGLLVNANKISGGIAIDHINQPTLGYIEEGTASLPIKYAVHLAYDWQKNEDSKFTFAPSVLCQRQLDFTELNLMASFRYKWLVWTVGWQRTNSYLIGLGMQSKMFRFSYAYNPSFSKFSNSVIGSHEASLRFLFNCKEKKEKIIPVSSISF